MSLLTASEAKDKIAEQVSIATDTLQIISAYCKIPAVEFIDKNICNTLKEKKLMVRFLLSDIINGSSDLSLYEYCKTHSWQMYVRFDLHAKTYIFDRSRCVLGSANLTSRGMNINFHGNYELSTFAAIDADDLKKIDLLFENAILMTDELYSAMKTEYSNATNSNMSSATKTQWSNSIECQFNPKIDTLFTYDFPVTKTPDFNDINCFEFLEITHIPSQEELFALLRWSKPFLWLYNFISNCDKKTSYFGEITMNLHNALINDPKPYRREVKELLSNLLGWIEALGIMDVVIDTPNYSQRVRIISGIS